MNKNIIIIILAVSVAILALSKCENDFGDHSKMFEKEIIEINKKLEREKKNVDSLKKSSNKKKEEVRILKETKIVYRKEFIDQYHVDTVYKELVKCDSVVVLKDLIIVKQDSIIATDSMVISSQDIIIEDQGTIIGKQSGEIKRVNKENKRIKRKLFFTKSALGITVAGAVITPFNPVVGLPVAGVGVVVGLIANSGRKNK